MMLDESSKTPHPCSRLSAFTFIIQIHVHRNPVMEIIPFHRFSN